MVKHGTVSREKDLLILWRHRENEYLPFNKILANAKHQLNFEKRTTINYLNRLVSSSVLEKHVDNNRKTFYRPKDAIETKKAILKDTISQFNNIDLLNTLDTFSLFLLKALNDAYESSQETPGFLEILESARSQFLKLKQSQETIKRAAGKINQQKAKRE